MNDERYECATCCYATTSEEKFIKHGQTHLLANDTDKERQMECSCHGGNYNQFCKAHGLNGYYQRAERSRKEAPALTGRGMMTAEQLRKPTFEREVSVERAELAAQRLTNSHFNNNRETHPHARVSIPTNQDDDDIVIFDFIAQAAAQLAEKEREIERLTMAGLKYHDQWKAAEERLKEAQESLDDKRTLARQLDVIWNGEKGAAKQASLCDIVSQIEHELPRLRQREAELEQRWIAVEERLPDDGISAVIFVPEWEYL